LKIELKEAIAIFNRGKYFDAAERFEQAAVAVEPELKELAGALNRLAAALHLRFLRGGRQATINLLSQAMMTLDDFKPSREGIDIGRLFEEISAYTEELRATPRNEISGVRRRARLFVERRRAPKIHVT
jgi:predicted metal-dependent hydrolase